MASLLAQKREKSEKLDSLRSRGSIPGVLYGSHMPSVSVQVTRNEFERLYKQVGESTLIDLALEGKETPVLIREIQRDPLSAQILHVDFYQPDLTREVEITVPLVFGGESPAAKGGIGTVIRNIQEVGVKALPQHLPREISVDLTRLANLDDKILVQDLMQNVNFKILRDDQDIVAQVVPLEKIEEELKEPTVQDVTAVEKIEKEKKEKETETPTGENETAK